MPRTKQPKPEAPKTPPIRMGSPLDWFIEAFPKEPVESQKRDIPNIWFRVGVMKDIPPTDSRFEYCLDMGMPNIEKILFHEPLNLDGELTFVFPERHMTVHDEHGFVYMLVKHPQIRAAKMTIVDIVTKSPLLISGFRREDIRIFSQAHDNERNRKLREAREKAELIKDVRGRRSSLDEVDSIVGTLTK